MNAADFDKIVNETCDSIKKILSSKAKEYAKDDRLYNFKRAAKINQTTPELALAGMLVKHWVSVLDLIEGTLENSGVMVNEKIGDTINYLILLKAILQEKRAELDKYRGSVDIATDAFKETATRERALTEAVTVSGHDTAFAETVRTATEQVAKTSKYPDKTPSVVTGPEGDYGKFIKDTQNKPGGAFPAPTKFDVIGINVFSMNGFPSLIAKDVDYNTAVGKRIEAQLKNVYQYVTIEPCSNQQ